MGPNMINAWVPDAFEVLSATVARRNVGAIVGYSVGRLVGKLVGSPVGSEVGYLRGHGIYEYRWGEMRISYGTLPKVQ